MKNYIDSFKIVLALGNKKIWLIVQLFISSALGHITSLLPPIATSGIIAVITDKNFNGIWFYVLLYICFYAVYFKSWYWNYKTYGLLGKFYHLEGQKRVFEKVSENEEIFSKISKGNILGSCSDDVRYLVDVVDCSVEAIMGIIKLIIIFFIFIKYNVLVALFVLFLDLFYLFLMNENSKKVAKHYEGTRKYDDKIIDTLSQMLINIKQVKTLNLMSNLNINLDKTRKRWSEQYASRRNCLTARYNVIPIVIYTGKILLYIYLAFLVIKNKMTLDKLVLLISYFEMTVTCTDKLLERLLNLSNYSIRANRIKTIIDYKSANEFDFGDIDNDYINGIVEFKNVCYEVKHKRILDNVSFKIYPNEINTIVGHSGSGKTTIINLLYRLIKVKCGEILIDNENIYNYSNKIYTSNVSGVFQKPFVFEMSIKDNLSLVDSDVRNQIEACKRVGIHDFIESLPKRYNTIIGEDGHLFSEGQKQLLAIARALLSKSEILLLDEITSNIDPNTTTKIVEILKDLKQDHTIIMITHKPEMMEIADRIIVLDKGKVISKGTNSSVFNKCALYRELKNRTFASVSNIELE